MAAGFQQMLERCIAANAGNADAADMVRRAKQALATLAPPAAAAAGGVSASVGADEDGTLA